ncbi:hypothetical protein DVJ78_07185 [Humibacter sp. BT305]|nr:hypothetical protein DVJ78_07185 [Humibacter sp. BT305]
MDIVTLIIGIALVAAGTLTIVFRRSVTQWREEMMASMGGYTELAARAMRRIHFTMLQGIGLILLGSFALTATVWQLVV